MVHVNFIVDCSGSMGATVAETFGVKVARWQAMRWMVLEQIKSLDNEDTVAIIEFESQAQTRLGPTTVKDLLKSGPQSAFQQLSNTRDWGSPGRGGEGYPIFYPRGGTNIPEALKEAVKITQRIMSSSWQEGTINLLYTDMWDQTGQYIFGALMSPCGNTTCLDALLKEGPLFVTVITSDSVNEALKGCEALKNEVSIHYGKHIDGNTFNCFVETFNPADPSFKRHSGW